MDLDEDETKVITVQQYNNGSGQGEIRNFEDGTLYFQSYDVEKMDLNTTGTKIIVRHDNELTVMINVKNGKAIMIKLVKEN